MNRLSAPELDGSCSVGRPYIRADSSGCVVYRRRGITGMMLSAVLLGELFCAPLFLGHLAACSVLYGLFSLLPDQANGQSHVVIPITRVQLHLK